MTNKWHLLTYYKIIANASMFLIAQSYEIGIVALHSLPKHIMFWSELLELQPLIRSLTGQPLSFNRKTLHLVLGNPMTQAMINTYAVNKVPRSSHMRATSFVEHRQAIRSAIVAARPVMPDDHSRRAKLYSAKKIWDKSLPVAGSIADVYFQQCGFIYEPGVMGHVRFNPAVLYEPTREDFPALIAPVHNLDGEFVGIHKTYLAADGTDRANVRGEARRMLGKCHGSYIQLSEATGFRLVVTESIEAGLAIQQACPGFPVWSAMTPGNMRAPVPAVVKELILCADGDGPNREANAKLVMDAVREHMDRGVRVSLATHVQSANFAEIL
jgi:hypothetical protein